MPSIQGGGPQFHNLRPTQSQQAVPAQKVATEAQGPKDTVRMSQTPTQTTQNVQRQQNLTSEATQNRIQQLLQNSMPNAGLERPQLSILQKGSMASALANLLADQHVPEQAQPQNLQAQLAAGQQQTVSTFRPQGPGEGQDTAWQRSAQSGRKLKKDEDKDSEFSMMDDSAGEGMSQQDTNDDQRSGAQKQKLLLEEKRRREKEAAEHAAFTNKPKLKLPPVPQTPLDSGYKPIPPKAELKKPEIKKPEIKRMNTLQAKPTPSKKAKADEWDF
ncbi:hypothetical protein COW36_01295 [bacterium (Candidatus Blackallbacteria) CG17_big_fil_post_rev_8_21_14_2_50_48_46]|uniref:Uncharacterized protein n=1 Tax=bacterium (Candidatus Blackallbacteria) CG17_big_fil_post_rev_8_21_14_2_50_48_46 TaxID=2014261 RepID=A0A2M7GBD1_9BACT|nr:MAG: hypothetical protein COW64_09880 [bacterium (Candidatus Blackallbacteria) CG18_big_fil_WC_8_21_14_2_50_49_26]PIW19502.1 MAG: hypothetical protein COW36_01295 [bacterium (Candidatus Blackallbacteria) CG17_big_fil_post_rev_8_21_14_2_50_48_46]PIW48894.1 MAG: hypothetical protein COW20_07160 [bacterium (Candidatus Blackallbacteria) CG13_big_fil_rev_8_21_14_2_50_49_14]